MLKKDISNYKNVIWYLILGGISTLINIFFYYVLYNYINFNNEISNIIAWIVTILFVYFTNRVKVFDSKAKGKVEKIIELFKFILARLFTGIIDIGFMYLTVSYMHWNSLFMKVVSNIIVIVSNYILSKTVVFKKK